MSDDRGRGVSRRAALKLAGSGLAAAGGVAGTSGTAAAADCDGTQPTQYVVNAPIITSGDDYVAIGSWVETAVETLDASLGYGGDLEFVQQTAGDTLDIDLSDFSSTKPQKPAFEQIIGAIPESDFLDAIRAKDQVDDDAELSDMYFVFGHGIGGADIPQGDLGFTGQIGGWGGADPEYHGRVDGEQLDMVLFGPTGSLTDRLDIEENFGELGDIGTLRILMSTYQAVGHALGATHRHGGYRTRDGKITDVSVMASGHVLGEGGRYDMRTGTVDGDPWVTTEPLVESGGSLKVTDRGCLVERTDAEETFPVCRYSDFRFEGWGGGRRFPASASLPEEEEDENGERTAAWFEGIHSFQYTSAARQAMTKTLRNSAGAGDSAVTPVIDVPDEINLGMGDSLDPAATESEFPDDPEAVVYEWRVWPKGAPRDRVNNYDTLVHRYGEEPSVSYDDLRDRGVTEEDDLVVQLGVFVVPEDEYPGPDDEGDDSGGVLSSLAEADSKPGAEKEIPPEECRDDEWADVLFNRTQVTIPVTVDRPPQPAFTVDADQPTTEGTVTFDASGTTDPEGDAIIAYEWTFEGPVERLAGQPDLDTDPETTHVPADGETSGEASYETVEQSFEQPGKYQVTLEVTNGRGESNTTTRTVAVYRPDQLEATLETPDVLPVGEPSTFRVAVEERAETGEVVYDWTIERVADATTTERESQVVEFTPERTGEYTITVEVIQREAVTIPGSSGGKVDVSDGRDTLFREVASATFQTTVTANDPPEVEIEGPDQVPPDRTATFEAVVTNADPGDEYDYEWQNPGALVGDTRETSAQFTSIGDRTARVEVTDRYEEPGVAEHTFEVEEPGEAPEVIIRGPDSPEAGSEVTYIATADGAEGETTYDWRVGGETVDGDRTLDWTFEEPVDRTVEVEVTDERGYDTTAAKTVAVQEETTSVPPESDDPVGDLVFADDFDYGTAELGASGWSGGTSFATDSSSLTVTSRVAQQTITHAQPQAAGSFVFEGVQNSASIYGMELQFIGSGQGTPGYFLFIGQNRGETESNPAWQDIRLVKRTESGKTPLLDLTQNHGGTPNDIRIDRDPDTNTFTAFLNGSKVGTVTDGAVTSSTTMSLRFDGGGNTQFIDRIEVRKPADTS